VREYRGGELEGVTIVGYGLSLKVFKGKAEVEYDGIVGDYFEVLDNGKIVGGTHGVALTADQMSWLKDNRNWVKAEIVKCDQSSI
jgi:hypothetical protein